MEKDRDKPVIGIEPSEITPIFKGIISGEFEMKFVKGHFWGGSTNAIRFTCQGYEIELFHDVNHIDYVVVAIAPDGREAGYEYWRTNVADADVDDPISQLTEEEHDLLVERFEEKHEFYLKEAKEIRKSRSFEKPAKKKWWKLRP